MSPKALPRAGKRDLTSGSLAKNLFRLAAPLVAGMVLSALYNLVDAFWLGRWSKEALAAPGVCMPFFFIVIAFGMGFGAAGTALVSQHTGAGRYRDADHAAGQNLLLLCSLALILGIPMWLLAPQLLRLAQVPATMMPQALIYLRTAMLGLPFTVFYIAYGAVLRALGDTVTVVIIGAVSNVVNLVLDPLLIFGWGGIPSFGVGGAATATVVSQVVSAAACYFYLRRGRAGLHLVPADLRPDWPVLRKAVSVGLPAAIGNSSNSFGFAVFQAMVNSFDTTVIAAFTVGFRVLHFFSIPGQAMAMAAAPMVGQALGADKAPLARRAVGLSVALVAGVMFLPAVFLTFGGGLVARAFVADPEVVAEASRFFMVVPFSSYFFSVIMVLMAAFYGSGHTRPVMLISILRLWVFRIPLALLLGFTLGWGSLGIFLAMVMANFVCAGVALALFRMGKWTRAVVPTAAETMAAAPAAEAVTASDSAEG